MSTTLVGLHCKTCVFAYVWPYTENLMDTKVQSTFQICTRPKALQSPCSVQVDTRLDRRHIHGEEFSVAFSRSIGMELDSEGSIVSTCTLNLKMLHQSSVPFLYELAKARPHNVLHF